MEVVNWPVNLLDMQQNISEKRPMTDRLTFVSNDAEGNCSLYETFEQDWLYFV